MDGGRGSEAAAPDAPKALCVKSSHVQFKAFLGLVLHQSWYHASTSFCHIGAKNHLRQGTDLSIKLGKSSFLNIPILSNPALFISLISGASSTVWYFISSPLILFILGLRRAVTFAAVKGLSERFFSPVLPGQLDNTYTPGRSLRVSASDSLDRLKSKLSCEITINKIRFRVC